MISEESMNIKRYQVSHVTRYRYTTPVSECHNESRLMLRQHGHQHVHHSELRIQPIPTCRHDRTDVYGNHVTYFAIHQPHTMLEIRTASEISVGNFHNDYSAFEGLSWEMAKEQLWGVSIDPARADVIEFALESPFVPLDRTIASFALEIFRPGRSLFDAVCALNQYIYDEFVYDPAFTTVMTPVLEVFHHRRGVCQDFAHLFLACLRSLGLAARYVSGYLETLPPPGAQKLQGADASHAWVSVYFPCVGWLDLDPTNGTLPGEQHLTLAWGRDYGDVIPVNGVLLGGGKTQLHVAVDVKRMG